MQTSNNISYLFAVGCEIKYVTYIVGWRLYKPVARGRSLSQRHLNAEATSPVRREIKELRAEADHSSP
jgi:hypothetical protein